MSTRQCLGDVVTLQRGTTYRSALLGLPGPVLLGLASITRDGGFRRDSLRTYGGQSDDKHLLRPGDLYVSLKDVTQSGDLLGSVSRVPIDIPVGRLTQDTVKLVFTGGDQLTDYVYWLLRTPQYRQYCRAHSMGTTNLSMSRDDFLAFPVPEPAAATLATVRALQALDDKIDLNRRMNETLEAVARAIFKSWFVDFDPVRAKASGEQPWGMDAATAALFSDSFAESDLGEIPQGWRVGVLGDVASVALGGDWGEDFAFAGAVEAYCLRGVDLQHLRSTGHADAPKRWLKPTSIARRRMDDCDILIAGSGMGPVGRSLWIPPDLEVNFKGSVTYSNFCKRVRCSSPATAIYVDRVLTSMHDSREVWECVNGTSIPNLDVNGLISGKRIVIPPDAVLRAYAEFLRPVVSKLYSSESRTLAELRDMLLPTLLSGEVRVGAGEKMAEAAS